MPIRTRAKAIHFIEGTVFLTCGFLLNLLFTVSLTAVAVWLFVVVNSGDTVLNSFDPVHILEVDAASDLKAIKRGGRYEVSTI